jgi:hypothetical protein
MYLSNFRLARPFGYAPRDLGYGAFYGAFGEATQKFACTAAELAAIRTATSKPALTVAQLDAALAEAVRRAVAAANRAATLLEAHPRTTKTTDKFRSVFGAGPDLVPAWRPADARWRDLGELVARRLRFVSRILAGNQIAYRCAGCTSATATACTTPPAYAMRFGLRFWRRWAAGKWHLLVSTLVHEATHIYFHRLVSHRPARRRAVGATPTARSNSPYCYALVTTRLNDFPDKPLDVTSCAAAR